MEYQTRATGDSRKMIMKTLTRRCTKSTTTLSNNITKIPITKGRNVCPHLDVMLVGRGQRPISLLRNQGRVRYILLEDLAIC